MARARNIKPGFFTNEDLAECSPFARLLFVGLWLLADREGRLEDRPKRIKGNLFAFDTVDVDQLLQELQTNGFILRYTTEDGVRAIQVLQFAEHQRPHYSEKPSVIMPPVFRNTGSIIESDFAKSPEHSGIDPPLRGGRNALNPDSLNPDSLNPELIPPTPVGVGCRQQNAADPETDPSQGEIALAESPAGDGDHDGERDGGDDRRKPAKVPECPHAQVLQLWAEVLPQAQQPRTWTTQRRLHLRARWREAAVAHGWTTEADGLAYFRKLFRWVSRSDFLMGRAQVHGRRPFDLDLPWLLKPENMAKVVEGKFHDGAPQ